MVNKDRIMELEQKIKEQQEICSQYQLALAYTAFDLEATRREKNVEITKLKKTYETD